MLNSSIMYYLYKNGVLTIPIPKLYFGKFNVLIILSRNFECLSKRDTFEL